MVAVVARNAPSLATQFNIVSTAATHKRSRLRVIRNGSTASALGPLHLQSLPRHRAAAKVSRRNNRFDSCDWARQSSPSSASGGGDSKWRGYLSSVPNEAVSLAPNRSTPIPATVCHLLNIVMAALVRARPGVHVFRLFRFRCRRVPAGRRAPASAPQRRARTPA